MRRHNLVSSSLRGRLLPILALVAGMGFVVPGGAVPAAGPVAPDRTGIEAPAVEPGSILSIAPAESRGELATVRAAGFRTLLASGARADAGPSGSPVRGRRSPFPAVRPDSTSAPPAGAATAVSVRDALARAGRLSAPTTAPPASPF